ncbi:hypothetical protein GCM10007904_17070 [Oharaeibacter diazotrophicus]|nr:hypothetical protein GCM10007904_17070 [Oharaeibacter diazotrophicus]
MAPIAAAIAARADVRNNGDRPPTATRVAGREPLKITTPTSPLPQPSHEDRIANLHANPGEPKRRGLVEPATVRYDFDEPYG